MSNLGEKVKGVAEVVGGTIEKTIGEVFGNAKLKAEGAADVAKGKTTWHLRTTRTLANPR